jgi:hypothetical protein
LNLISAAKGFIVLGVGFFAFSTFSACELTVDLDPLQSGAGACPSGTKGCDGKCVSVKNPFYGCGAPDSCFPCSLKHVSAYNCTNLGSCGISACEGSYEDCNKSPTDGCEWDTENDPEHCGQHCADVQCSVTNGEPACVKGQCKIRLCTVPFNDCDSNPLDCETNMSQDAAHCGSCTTPCDAATQMCVPGTPPEPLGKCVPK